MRAIVLLAAASLSQATVYNLLRFNAGQSFFDAFQFFGTYDFADNSPTPDFLNSGDDFMANRSYAFSAGLVSVNDQNHAIVRVDDTSIVPFNEKRFSVRINTTELYSFGNVFVFDAVHIPFGCSVWPAYWTAARAWPNGGEIDIMEQVNLAQLNQMSLHTSPGCTIAQANTGMTGTVSTTNCGDTVTNSGCIIVDPDPNSFSTFNQAGGGMWVTEFQSDQISIWFFSRANIPAALETSANASSIDTSTLGTPTAMWPSTSCDIATFFQPQSIVIDITLCGVFAREVFNNTCPPVRLNSCYLDWVIGPPTNYTEAFFEIVSLRVFNDGTPGSFTGIVPPPDGTEGDNGTSGTSGSGSGNGTLSGGGNGLGQGGGGSPRAAAGALVAGFIAASAWLVASAL